ncbi:MAG: hypothetical protein U0941_26095 [Planctomycetaceae bacterium]
MVEGLLRRRCRPVLVEGQNRFPFWVTASCAQAQNLRDSGLHYVIGQRPGSKNADLAAATASSLFRWPKHQGR